MYNLRKIINFNLFLWKTHCLKHNTNNELKLFWKRKPLVYYSELKIHTSIQKFNDATNSQNGNVLVYEAPLKKRVKIVKLLSLSSSMLGFAVFPKALTDLSEISIFVACAAGAVSAFFLSTPFMLHWITKRYVLDLHFEKDSKTFTAKTYNIICQIEETKFKADDVTVPDLPGMLSSILVRGKPLFVDASMISDPDAYSHMMGYDKPFDIALKPEEEKGNKAS